MMHRLCILLLPDVHRDQAVHLRQTVHFRDFPNLWDVPVALPDIISPAGAGM